ncbi:MAG: hypothetical protein K5985_11110 [Lachnospiraceae bacterium]|nr:hypothetical protein [Lachnospiraceae bacterium]
MPKYSIRKNRLKAGYMEGLRTEGESGIVFEPKSHYHALFLKALDGAETGAEWGRFSLTARCSEDIVYSVHFLATDLRDFSQADFDGTLDEFFTSPEIPVPEKLSVLKNLGAKRTVGGDDCLLYDLSGRYLYIALEVAGEGTGYFEGLNVDSIGDNFMNTFPEIYRQRGGFFHRFMSVFSSVYNDFEEEIAALPENLDLNTCSRELLIAYGSWMGIDLSGDFLEEAHLRTLVKEAYQLNRMKGSRKAIERILEILLEEKPTLIEHNRLRERTGSALQGSLPKGFRERGNYDITVLVKKCLTEELRHKLFFVLDQFKPVRTVIHLVQLDDYVVMDSNSYLDLNARIPEERNAVLDEGTGLDGVITLV